MTPPPIRDDNLRLLLAPQQAEVLESEIVAEGRAFVFMVLFTLFSAAAFAVVFAFMDSDPSGLAEVAWLFVLFLLVPYGVMQVITIGVRIRDLRRQREELREVLERYGRTLPGLGRRRKRVPARIAAAALVVSVVGVGAVVGSNVLFAVRPFEHVVTDPATNPKEDYIRYRIEEALSRFDQDPENAFLTEKGRREGRATAEWWARHNAEQDIAQGLVIFVAEE